MRECACVGYEQKREIQCISKDAERKKRKERKKEKGGREWERSCAEEQSHRIGGRKEKEIDGENGWMILFVLHISIVCRSDRANPITFIQCKTMT